MTTIKQTNGKVFNITSCVRIKGTVKAFRGIKFTFNGTPMTIWYGLETGNQFFWDINGRTQRSDKGQFYKWLNKFAGPDVRKLAGYTKLMRAVTESASNARAILGGVPVFTKTELSVMKHHSVKALHAQINKALAKAHSEQLERYEMYVSSLYREEGNQAEEATRRIETSGNREATSTDGVKEGSDEAIKPMTLKQARAEAKAQGLRGYSRIKLAELLEQLGQAVSSFSNVGLTNGKPAPAPF